MSINLKSLENAFYSDGYRLGMKVAESDYNREILFDSVSKMYESIDDFIYSLSKFAKEQNQRIDCQKGCHWCCHQPVYALDYEMEYLNHVVLSGFNLQNRIEIKKRAIDKKNKLNKLDKIELPNSKYPCPLLVNGACIAYSGRPMACRIYLSSNLKSCLNFFHHPENEKSIPELFDITLRVGRMMNEGFKAAMKTKGRSAMEFRIEEKLLDKEN